MHVHRTAVNGCMLEGGPMRPALQQYGRAEKISQEAGVATYYTPTPSRLVPHAVMIMNGTVAMQ